MNPNNSLEKPAVQVAIDELQTEAVSPEDQATLQEWQSEQDANRAEALKDLGSEATKVAMLPDGSIVPASEAESMALAGEQSHPYGDSGRRA